MTDNEDNGNEEEYFSEGNAEEIESINKKNSVSSIEKTGNGYLHLLPAKIFYNGVARVNSFFDTLIEPNPINDTTSTNFISSFRGRPLNGVRVILDSKFTMKYYRLMEKNERKYIVEQSKDIKDYFVWKYDESIPQNDNCAKMETILKNLDVLK